MKYLATKTTNVISNRNDKIEGCTDPQWPPSSPDLSPLDFSLWAKLRKLVFVTPLPNTKAEWLTRIKESMSTLSADRRWNNRCCSSVLRRAIECKRKDGGHFEQGLKRSIVVESSDSEDEMVD